VTVGIALAVLVLIAIIALVIGILVRRRSRRTVYSEEESEEGSVEFVAELDLLAEGHALIEWENPQSDSGAPTTQFDLWTMATVSSAVDVAAVSSDGSTGEHID
jgi:hypothetical protein